MNKKTDETITQPIDSDVKKGKRTILAVGWASFFGGVSQDIFIPILPLYLTQILGFDKAVVADGGVPLTEIDTKTMRSLRCENAYIIGDLLHVNRPSGGFSLQLCWTTGWVAGHDAGR